MDNKIDEMSLDLVREEEVAEEKKCKRRKHHLAIDPILMKAGKTLVNDC